MKRWSYISRRVNCSYCSDVDVFQSGVLFLGYGFNLPRAVTAVGLLPQDVIAARIGVICESRNPEAGTRDIYHELAWRRAAIHAHANEHYSWTKVAGLTQRTYGELITQ
jgi:hypothetical protein